MGYFYKKLIFAGILSATLAGFCGSTGASAVEGFSIHDLMNNRLTLSDSTNYPISADRESSNPDSNVSRNENPFPSLLFNGAPNNTAWGYDGKGIIFENNDNLINGNPQLSTAKRGDTLQYSLKIESQRYNDEAETKPVQVYAVYVTFSEGLKIDLESIVIKVDDNIIDLSSLETYYGECDEGDDEYTLLGGARSYFYFILPWTDDNEQFLYDEDAEIVATYTANVSDDATGEVWNRGIYMSDETAFDFSIFSSTDHQVTAIIDGNIVIRRIDESGKPLAGAKYSAEGIRAIANSNGTYSYDEAGDVTEFVTDENGEVIIVGVPFGEYKVTEIMTPSGHGAAEAQIVKTVGAESIEEYTYTAEEYFMFPSFYGYEMNLLPYMEKFEGEWGLNEGGTEELTFNPETGKYETSSASGPSVRKDGGDYYAFFDNVEKKMTYDEANNRYYAFLDFADALAYSGYYEDGSERNRLTFIDDNTVIVGPMLVDGTATFTRNSGEECFYGDVSQLYESASFDVTSTARLCPDGDKYYQLVFPANTYDTDLNMGYRYVYMEQYGSYVVGAPYVITVFSLNDDGASATFTPYVWFDYYEKEDMYFMLGSPGAIQVQLRHGFNERTIHATMFLFQDGEAGGDHVPPEDVPANPQTADLLPLAVLVATVLVATSYKIIRCNTSR